MITAELIKAEERDNFWKLEVEYTDGSNISIDSFKFSGNAQSLKRHVMGKVQVKETVQSFDFKTLLNKPIDITPDPVIPPTAEEIAKAEWFTKLAKMEKFQRLVRAQVMIGNESAITDLAAELIAEFNNSWFGDL